MKTEVYGGDSWSKKIARRFVIGAFFDRDLRIGGRFERGPRKSLVLAGPEAADARVLRGFGVDPATVTAVDAHAATATLASTAMPTADVHHASIQKIAGAHGRCYDLLVMDMCAGMSEKSVDDFASVACRSLVHGGVAIAAFSYGRGSPETRRFMKQLSEEPICLSDPRNAHASFDKVFVEVNSEKMARAEAFLIWANASFRKRNRSLFLLGNHPRHPSADFVFYTARKESGAQTPMVYVVGTILDGRAGCVAHQNTISVRCVTGSIEVAKSYVKSTAVRLALQLGSQRAADLFNVDRGRVSAWMAVDTMRRQRAA